MKNSPRVENASMSIARLMRQITDIPMVRLKPDASHLESIQRGDVVQEQVPLFIQQINALHAEKYAAYMEAFDKGEHARAVELYNEEHLLHAMLTYFVTLAAPPEIIFGSPYTWHICKDHVLVYRKKPVPDASDEDEAEAPRTPPAETKKQKLN